MGLNWQKRKILLGSQSPRRAQLLREMGLNFRQLSADINEVYPSHLKGAAIAEYLAYEKAKTLLDQLEKDEILICSDTVVWLEGKSLEKAGSMEEAREMLSALSGKKHEVITGLFIGDSSKTLLVNDKTEVQFKDLDLHTIEHYIQEFKPFDKAGAYGIQEWIGMIGIESIHGSFFTVMGLPCHLISDALRNW